MKTGQTLKPGLLLLASGLSLTFTLAFTLSSYAQEAPDIAGEWVFNQDVSDVTDRQIEVSLKAAGEKVKRRWFNRDKDIYRGGPAEQELYDHISYDKELSIDLSTPEEFHFVYEDDFHRSVYTDNRRRSVSLSNIDSQEDFSFAHWADGILQVEARPRDGGFANESYSLINEGTQLKVELYIKPRVFQVPIEIVRIYDRKMPEQAH